MIFVIYPSDDPLAPTFDLMVVHARDQENMDDRMVSFLREDPGVRLYRVIDQFPDWLLQRVRVKPSSEVFEDRLIYAEFEDDI